MRRLIASSLLAIALVAGLASPPAEAGWYVWEIHPCRPDVAYRTREPGVDYWSRGWTYQTVRWGPIYDYYASQGWQCGWLGAPTGNLFFQGGLWRQWFEGGQVVSNY